MFTHTVNFISSVRILFASLVIHIMLYKCLFFAIIQN